MPFRRSAPFGLIARHGAILTHYLLVIVHAGEEIAQLGRAPGLVFLPARHTNLRIRRVKPRRHRTGRLRRGRPRFWAPGDLLPARSLPGGPAPDVSRPQTAPGGVVRVKVKLLASLQSRLRKRLEVCATRGVSELARAIGRRLRPLGVNVPGWAMAEGLRRPGADCPDLLPALCRPSWRPSARARRGPHWARGIAHSPERHLSAGEEDSAAPGRLLRLQEASAHSIYTGAADHPGPEEQIAICMVQPTPASRLPPTPQGPE